jgi:hypothetical protein
MFNSLVKSEENQPRIKSSNSNSLLAYILDCAFLYVTISFKEDERRVVRVLADLIKGHR